jgi:uncharacterized protein with GYD domain
MQGYVTLFKWTNKAVADFKGSPERTKLNKAAAEKMGCRVIGIWVTEGEYDLVAVWEAPDDQTAAAFALTVASKGYVTSQTMRAFSEEEFAQIVAKLP